MECPMCGSQQTRDSYIKKGAELAGKLVAKTLILPATGFLGQHINYAVGRAGSKLGGALYNKRVCEVCGHSWFYAIDSYLFGSASDESSGGIDTDVNNSLKTNLPHGQLKIKAQAGTKRYSSEAEHYYHLAECYIDGIEGYEKNTVLAFENYLKAAEKGHVLAMIELAYDYCNKESVSGLDLFKAEYWAKKAIEAGNPDGYFELYKVNASRFLRAEAVKCLDQGIVQGSLDCIEERAYILLYGFGLETDIEGKIDYDEALSLLEQVEWDSSHPHAFTMLGYAYQQKGCLQDAKINYEKALTMLPDSALIKYRLGSLLRIEGIKDLPVAKSLLEQSAEMGNIYAMNELGVMLYLGEGCEQNMSVAIEWFEKAAQQGYHTAMINLYDILSDEKPEEARYWLNKAAEEGDETAKERIKALDNTESVDLSLSKKIYDDELGNLSNTLALSFSEFQRRISSIEEVIEEEGLSNYESDRLRLLMGLLSLLYFKEHFLDDDFSEYEKHYYGILDKIDDYIGSMSNVSDEAAYLYYVANMYSIDRFQDIEPLEKLEELWDKIQEIQLDEEEVEFKVSFWDETAREIYDIMSEIFDLSEYGNSSSGYSDRNDDFIKNKIIEIVADKLSLDEDEVHTYSRIGEDLGADSLDAVELIMEMEKEFNIMIPDSAAEKVRTVGDIITYVKTHR